jgi:hypothetical protein
MAQTRDAECPTCGDRGNSVEARRYAGGPTDDRVTIEADDKDFTFDVKFGNAVLSGNVVSAL